MGLRRTSNRPGKSQVPRAQRPVIDVWILLSGGIDSAACVEFYKSRGFSVTTLFIDYGQISARRESVAARRVSNFFSVPLVRAEWTCGSRKGPGLIQGRNAFLAIAALMERGANPGIIALGIHSGTSYYDCSPAFLSTLRSVVSAYTDGCVRIAAPFLRWKKRTVLEFCRSHGVPLELTYSCESGRPQPCNECLSCRDLKVLSAV